MVPNCWVSKIFRSAQYVDLLSQAYPPQEEEVVAHREMISSQQSLPSPETSNSSSSAAVNPASMEVSQPPPIEDKASGRLETNDGAVGGDFSQSDTPPSSAVDDSKSKEPAQDSQSYGPVRRTRVPSKGGPLTMFRPAAMRHEDFVEVMREVVPSLIENVVQSEDASMSTAKRPAESPEEEPVSKMSKTEDGAALVETAIAYVETACCSHMESQQLWKTFKDTSDGAVEVFINQYFQKRAQKEIPASKNEPMLQARVDQAKVSEWQTLIDKGAVRILSAKESS